MRGYFCPPGVVGRGILDAPFDFRDPPGGAGLPGRGAAFDVKSGGKTTRACGPWTQGSTAAVLCVVPHVNRACVQRARPSVVIVSALPRLGGPRRSPRKTWKRLRWTCRANSAQGFRVLYQPCTLRTARRVVAPHGTVATTTMIFQRHSTDGGPAGQAGTAQQFSGLAG